MHAPCIILYYYTIICMHVYCIIVYVAILLNNYIRQTFLMENLRFIQFIACCVGHRQREICINIAIKTHKVLLNARFTNFRNSQQDSLVCRNFQCKILRVLKNPKIVYKTFKIRKVNSFLFKVKNIRLTNQNAIMYLKNNHFSF